MVWLLTLTICITTFHGMWTLFTDRKDLWGIYEETKPFWIFYFAIDFLQLSVGHGIRALGLQKIGTYVMLVTYYILMIPMAVGFAFHTGSHMDYHHKKKVHGMGIRGIWLSSALSLMFQLAMQLIILLWYVDWQEISDRVRDEFHSPLKLKE
jgi:Na+-driven multidrug efflux pump